MIVSTLRLGPPLVRTLAPLLFLLLLITFDDDRAQAQFLPAPGDVRVTRMNYSNSSGERGRTDFHYGRNGARDSAIWMLNDLSRHSANYHVFDSAGLLVEKYREFSDGLTSTETFAYDGGGRRLKENFLRSDGVGGEAGYQWDEEGRLASATCNKYKGWFTGKITYEQEGDRLSAATISRAGEEIGTIAYVYNQAGHLISETWDFGGQGSQTFTYEYEPIPARVFSASSPLMMMNPGFRVTAEDYRFNGEGGGPSEYFYDAEGRLEKKTFRREDGLKTETTYVFNARGDLESSHRSYHDDQTTDFSYSYDDALRMTGKTFRQSDGKEGFEAYSYDRLGRLAGATYRNMDFWLNGRLKFAYDDRGHLATGQFKGEDGFDAELEFETDNHGNVLRVHWEFSSGMTQTYFFQYGPLNSTPSKKAPAKEERETSSE